MTLVRAGPAVNVMVAMKAQRAKGYSAKFQRARERYRQKSFAGHWENTLHLLFDDLL
jgi:hypothetical protein